MGICGSKQNQTAKQNTNPRPKESTRDPRIFQWIETDLSIGSEDMAQDIDALEKEGIKRVICVGSKHHSLTDKIEYLVFDDVLDAPFAPIMDQIRKICEFESSGTGKMFIHCCKGLSRSSTVLFGILMKRNRWTFERTRDYVNKKRPHAAPNLGFEIQLRDWATNNWDFDSPNLVDWGKDWVSKVQDVVPGLLEDTQRCERMLAADRGEEVENRLFQLNYHFMTLHVERSKLDEPTNKLIDEYVFAMLAIQAKYVQNERSIEHMKNYYGVTTEDGKDVIKREPKSVEETAKTS